MAETRLESAPAFDIEELSAALDAHSPPYACPVCSSIAWNVWEDNTGLVSVVLWGKQNGEPYTKGTAVLSLSCRDCGYLRQHHVDTFRTYLEKLKRERSTTE